MSLGNRSKYDAEGFRFPLVRVQSNDHAHGRSAHLIVCGECGERDHLTVNDQIKGAGFVAKAFAQRGWLIGSRPAKDRCPEHAHKRKPHHEQTEPVMNTSPPRKVEPIARILPPAGIREMSIDDRRIIFAKLNDVYLDAAKGYSEGWTDKRISEDLGVPRAWVEKMREENFGPSRDNEEVKVFLAGVEALRTEASAIRGSIVTLQTKAGQIDQRLRELEIAAERIKKATGV